jgi:paraquat-inducible protein A
MTNQTHQLIACPDCDLLQRIPSLLPGEKLYCPRCRCLLFAGNRWEAKDFLPLVIGSLIFFILANVLPLLTISQLGITKEATMLTGIYELWLRGYELAAVVVAFCVVISPAVYLGCMLVITVSARRPIPPSWLAHPLRWSQAQQKWAMLEVMMVAVLISMIKLADYATVIPGSASYALGVLIILLTVMKITFSPEAVWNRMEWQIKPLPGEHGDMQIAPGGKE